MRGKAAVSWQRKHSKLLEKAENVEIYGNNIQKPDTVTLDFSTPLKGSIGVLIGKFKHYE